jgi:uncharacterized protein GlcG (DUF336 family)
VRQKKKKWALRARCLGGLSVIAGVGALAACTGGGGDQPPTPPEAAPVVECSGFCADVPTRLDQADVRRIVAQAVAEARARGLAGHIAVSDRVGNILAAYSMNGAPQNIKVATPGRSVTAGLEGVTVIPAIASAMAKALTGAYLSSEGNAFSTRVASQIVQEHFNPGEQNQPGGPLFGVQFSQLPCSDLSMRASTPALVPGPHRSPLGLSADPGGFPLYRNGTVVGGVGVEVDGQYGLDVDILDVDAGSALFDEIVALAATSGYGAPPDRRADRITVDGKTLRFSDAVFADLTSAPASIDVAAELAAGGNFRAVTGYTDASVRSGTAFGQSESGVVRATEPSFAALDGFVLVDAAGQSRFPPRDGTGAGALSASEVRAILGSGLGIANAARAQIRRPLGDSARVTIFVVGRNGEVLGAVRSRDAPMFGVDVALQKARSVLFLSGAGAAASLAALPPVRYFQGGFTVGPEIPFTPYVDQFRSASGRPTALADGAIAFGARSIGNAARPFFPDGIIGTLFGPFSKTAGEWSVFSTGLQLDLAHNALVNHVAFLLGAVPGDVPQNCTGVAPFGGSLNPPAQAFAVVNPIAQIANGLQIFPGGVPIYRGNELVGAVGVSGDGIEQDDMVAFLGVHRASEQLGNAISNAPPVKRADGVVLRGTTLLRYIQCPQSPFLGSNDQLVCDGK